MPVPDAHLFPTFAPARIPPDRLFVPRARRAVEFPIQHVVIAGTVWSPNARGCSTPWRRCRPTCSKPEILTLLAAEKDPTYRLILDLMWSTGARVSEVLALTPASFIDDGYDYEVVLKTLKQGPGRPSRAASLRSPKRYVPIADPLLKDRVQSTLWAGRFKSAERIFPMVRQTVNRHIHALVAKAGGAPFWISAHTFRHSFAIHLLLHGRPLKYVSQLLGASVGGEYRDLHQCADGGRGAFYGRGGFSLAITQ